MNWTIEKDKSDVMIKLCLKHLGFDGENYN